MYIGLNLARILIVIISITCCSNIFSQTFVKDTVGGVWTKTNSPYIVNGDIYIDSMLTIEAGVKIYFNGYYKMTSYGGRILALGSPDDSILFSYYHDSNKRWIGIKLYPFDIPNPSQTNIFQYCIFEYSYYGLVVGSLESEDRSDSVRNSTFRYNNIGVECGYDFGELPVIIDCNFIYNQNGLLSSWASPKISYCNFSQNAIACHFYATGGYLHNCTIEQDSIGISLEDDYGMVTIGGAEQYCNKFYNNQINFQYAQASGPAFPFNASFNYWGTTDFSIIKSKIHGNFIVEPFTDSGCNTVQTVIGSDELLPPISLNIFPNPFYRSSTSVVSVNYFIPIASEVVIDIQDVLGRSGLIKSFGLQEKGSHDFIIPELNSGRYFIRLNVNKQSVVKKLLVIE